jgi:hypothetical protein
MVIFFGWIIFSFILGFIGSSRTAGFWGTFLVSLILSPLVGFVILLFSKNIQDEEYKANVLKQLEISKEKSVPVVPKSVQEKNADNLKQLEKLFELKEKGIITVEEFDQQKAKLLNM